MTEQNAPERIWADLEVGTWFDGEPYSDGDVEYVRADLYYAAWNEAIDAVCDLEPKGRRWISRDAIRALRREPSK